MEFQQLFRGNMSFRDRRTSTMTPSREQMARNDYRYLITEERTGVVFFRLSRRGPLFL